MGIEGRNYFIYIIYVSDQLGVHLSVSGDAFKVQNAPDR